MAANVNFEAKTTWVQDEIVYPADANRWEKGIKDCADLVNDHNARIPAVEAKLLKKVSKAGDTMTGALKVPTADLSVADTTVVNREWAEKKEQTRITNCLTKIPQDINIELSNGTLTLKSGSKVYRGNGDLININSDISVVYNANATVLIVANVSGNALQARPIENCFSGTSDPQTPNSIYYDTANNVIRFYTSQGVQSEVSFPIAICTATGQISSIDQVFSGFGYIGSTIFALPGVEGLVPNGRKTDGSCNNSTASNSSLDTISFSSKVERKFGLTSTGFYVGANVVYNPVDNKNYNSQTGNYLGFCDCGTVETDDTGRIIYFISKPVFHAADYFDFDSRVSNVEEEKVSKSGDTMTGALNVPTPSESENSTVVPTTAWVKKFLNDKLGKVYLSQSSSASDNPGALPLFTGETIASANTIYPEFYNWILSHAELQCTAEEYEAALSTYGECAKYVIGSGSIRLPLLKNYIKAANTAEGITQKSAGLPNITGNTGYESGLHSTLISVNGSFSSGGGSQYSSIGMFSGRGKLDTVYFDASLSNNIYGSSNTVTPAHTTLYPWVCAYNAAVPASTADAAKFQNALSGKLDLPSGKTQADVDFVVESYHDESGNWYRLYKSGWVEQGGIIIPDTTENITVSYLKPFSDVNYTLMFNLITTRSGSASWDDETHPKSKLSTGFTMYKNTGISASQYMYYACGQGGSL